MAEAVCTSHECEDDHSVETSELLSAESSLPRHELDACSLSKLSPKKSRVSDALEVVDKNLEVSNIEKVQCSLEKVNLQCDSSLAEPVKTKPETKVAKTEVSKVEMSPGKRKLYSWLNKQMKIEMTDGRVLVGIFLCTDRDANVILGSCTEFLNPEVCGFTDEPRILGLVMVPGRHIVSIYHDAVDPSSTADTSQTRQ